MSPQHFITEVEEYLTWKGTRRDSWLLLVGRLFAKDSDISRWWRETKKNLIPNTWDEFKLEFVRYEESGFNKDELMTKLFSKQQKLHEAFETFAWDVNSAFTKINPQVTSREVQDRILNSCLPEISIVLRNYYSFHTIGDMVHRARQVICDLNKVRAIQGKQLLRARASDPQTKLVSSGPSPSNFRWRRAPQQSSTTGNAESQSTSGASAQNETARSEPSNTSSTQDAKKSQPGGKLCAYCKESGHFVKDCSKLAQRKAQRANQHQENK
jgi:hypothetical protein